MYLLDKFENKYIIKGILKTTTPIHIGCGTENFSPTAVDNSVIRDENNNPFIPGSSLKGVLRSFMERLLSSEVFEDYSSCIVNGKKNCIDEHKEEIELFEKNLKGDINADEKRAMKIYTSQCDVCKLFGGKSFASKLNIKDAKLIGEKANVAIRHGVGIDRDTLTGAQGVNYEFECVSAGEKFAFEMTVDNLDSNHKDLLSIIIRRLESGDTVIGGKASAGLGGIVLEDTRIYEVNRGNMREYFINGITKENEAQWEGRL